jgi:large subunit ribosomal protein L25
MKSAALKARLRSDEEKGTRACRKLRQAGEVPANLYGATKKDGTKTELSNTALAVSAYDVMQLIAHHHNVVEVQYDTTKELAIIREVQRDVFGDDVLHIDMEMIDASQRIHVAVELVFKGDSQGVKDGGRMQIAMHSLEIEALPLAVPEHILVRVDDLALGQVMHVSDLPLPEGVTAVTPGEQAVVQVVAVTEEAEEAEGEAPTSEEPEVISKGKSEEESN